MAAIEGQSKKKCVCSERMTQLEDAVKELNSRLSVVEECLLGMDSMRGRMFQLEKSMENALDRIMPRLDALLAGLPASATSQIASKPPIFPPYPNPASSPTRASASASPGSSTSQTATRAKAGSGSSPCRGCHSKAACSCPKKSSSADTGPVKNGLSADSPNSSSGAASAAQKASSKEKGASVENAALVAAGADLSVHILELERQLRAAAGRGDVVLCQKIMMSGIDTRKRDPTTGDTALHCAARGGHLGCIMLLLAVAKNLVISANKQRQTPLMLAAANGHVASVQLLLHQGKSWNNRQGGSKALMQAVTDKTDEVLQALLEGGVNVNGEDGASGPSPLQLAASLGHISSLQMLLKHGAEVGQINGEGQTALHKAAQNGHNKCIEVLLAAGANPLVKDTSGWEPLHLAARAGHIECVKLLLASGVDVNRPAANGQTPLVCATNECPEVEEVLRAAGAAVDPAASDSV